MGTRVNALSRWLNKLRPIPRAEESERKPHETAGEHSSFAAQVEDLLRDGADAAMRGQVNEAVSKFERALELRHDCAPAHLGLGRLWLRQERFEDAADELQLAVLFDPSLAAAHAELALLYAHQARNSQAHESVDTAIRHAGDSADVWGRCARVFKALNELERSAECYEVALGIEPHSADIACQLGYVRFLNGAYDAARAAYDRVLESSPNHVATLHNLGLLELETGLTAQALAHFERAAALPPRLETSACIGHALRDLGRLDEACAAYERVLAADPRFGDAQINLSYALLMRGDYARGWARYESRFEATGTGARDFGLPPWRGEPLGGRRLLIYAEQGIGDEIMFSSCIPEAMAAAQQCVIECNTRLAGLFSRSFPGALIHGGDKNENTAWLAKAPPCDYQIAIGSLPRHFRSTTQSFEGKTPYLVADSGRIEKWRRELRCDDRPLIGISWRGGALRGRQWLRSIPLEQWSGLLKFPHCRFVALQYGDCTPELDQVRASLGVDIVDLSAACGDIDELAAIVYSVDLVITVANTLAHVAGALGQPVWVLLPTVPEWRYPRRGTRMPWYGSMRLYRRTTPNGAAEAMTQVQTDLLTQFPSERRMN